MASRVSAVSPYVMDCARLATRVRSAQKGSSHRDAVCPRGAAGTSGRRRDAPERVDPQVGARHLSRGANARETAWLLSLALRRSGLRQEHRTDQDGIGALLACASYIVIRMGGHRDPRW